MSLHPEVVAAMAAVAQRGGNPASQHRLGQQVRRAVDRAARALATLAGLPDGEVTFAADAAEACVLACAHLGEGARVWVWPPPDGDVVLGRAAQVWAAWGLRVTAAPVKFFRVSTSGGPDRDVAAHGAPAALVVTLAGCGPGGAFASGDHATLVWAAAAGVPVHVDASAALARAPSAAGDEPGRAGPLVWPPGASPHSVVVDGPALGGPPGVAALCVATSPAPSRPGTVPRELAVGLGAAAYRLANGG